MARFTLPAAALLIPLLFFGATGGYRRSLGRETVTGLCLGLILLAFDWLTSVALGLVRFIAGLVADLAGTVGIRAPQLERGLDTAPRNLIVLGCIILFILGAYWIGNRLGGQAGSRLARLGGAAIGALNVLLLLTIISQRAQDVLGAARMRRLFLVPGSERGLDVRIPPLPPSAVLAQWSLYALLVLVLVAFFWGVSHLPRLRR